MRMIELRMDVTNTCNLRCIMCHMPFEGQRPHMMTLQEFERVAGSMLKRTAILYVSWATEPLLNPHLHAILRTIHAANVPCVVMVTNLTLLPTPVAENIHLVHRLHVSIDSADPVVYAAIRQRDCLNDVLDNVRRIQALKKERKQKYPHIAFNAVLLRMTIGKLKPLVDLATSMGVNELNLSYVSVPERYQAEQLFQDLTGLPSDFDLKNEVVGVDDPDVQTMLKEIIRYADAKGVLVTVAGRFSVMNRQGLSGIAGKTAYMLGKAIRFPPRAMLHLAVAYASHYALMKKAYCTFPFRQIVLTADGKVLPCCVWDDTDHLGLVEEASLGEIWAGPAFQELREKMLTGNVPQKCACCNRVNSKKRHGI